MPGASADSARPDLDDNRLHLLLVEDDPDDALLVSAQLTSAFGSIDIEHVRSLQAALDVVLTATFDLVLLDLGLPDSAGLATLQRIVDQCPESPIVILSGNDDEATSLEAIRLGAQDYVPKSDIDAELLPRVIHHAIRRVEVGKLHRLQGELFEALVSNSLDAVRVFEPNGVIKYAQGHFTGGRSEDMIGMRCAEIVHPVDLVEWKSTVDRLVAEGNGASAQLTVRLKPPHDDRWIEARLTNLIDHPAIGGIVTNARDITDRRNFEARLRHQATHDALTGLPNRTLAGETIAAAIDRAASTDTMVAVLFLDLDRFKVVNDTSGHDVGDELLIAVADRIRSGTRTTDWVARNGGDEFIVVAEHLSSDTQAMALAERIQDSLREPIHAGGHLVYTTASIGVAVTSGGDDTPEQLLSNADAAMYQAKRCGRARAEMFDSSLKNDLRLQRKTEDELRVAIESDQFRLHFQPILDVQTRTIRSVEALVRWQHPERGLLYPADFVGIAEDAGLQVAIDRWVLHAACDQIASWESRLGVRIGLNINMSAATVIDPSYPAAVDEVMRRTGVEARRLCMELTETALILYPAQAEATLTALRSSGVDVALDDFGTGYSSLAHLQRLPLTGIKIDRSFVAGLGFQASDTIIVRSTVNLGRDLDLRVTAEGVESVDQLKILATYGCDLAQGYLLDRPLTPEQLEQRFVDSDVRTTVWRSSLEEVGFDRARR